MLTDVQIAQQAKMEPITNIASKIGLSDDDIECYGKYKAKINFSAIKKVNNNPLGKLVLVSAINPTSAGEGKTTTMIGLAMALNQLNKKAIVAMREPSLGPCFGIKGGACGGGYSQVVPMEDINLHFTGDIHAITSANNLIAAMLDNSLQQGNALNIDPRTIVWKRCVDLNDRSLRHIVVGLGGKGNGVVREDGFDISVASEVMAVLCLANDLNDLKKRIAKMIVAYTYQGDPVTVNDLQATGAVTLLLKDAIKPNLVQTLENTPVIIHGGPFANIAHGCNSVIATKLALHLGEITLTEAGFGADLGAEKFFDIKCRSANLKPDAVVLVATIRALKLNGGLDKTKLTSQDMDALIKGSGNLQKHIENIKKYNVPVLVTLNVFASDTQDEIEYVKNLCAQNYVSCCLSKVFEQGGAGAIDVGKELISILENNESQFKPLYDLDLSIEDKITTIVKEIYGGSGISYNKKVENKINKLKELGFNNLPICIAKTQYSLSDNAKLLGRPKDFIVEVSDVIVNAGSGFIVVVCGDIMRMPGLPKKPAAINMDIDDNGEISGLF